MSVPMASDCFYGLVGGLTKKLNKEANHHSLVINAIIKVYTKRYRCTAAPPLPREDRKRNLNLEGQVPRMAE